MMKMTGSLRILAFLCGTMLITALAGAQTTSATLLLKDYRPRSIYKIPETRVEKAKFPVTDMHAHDYAPTPPEVETWLKTMDAVGLEKTVVMINRSGKVFDETAARYRKYPNLYADIAARYAETAPIPRFTARFIEKYQDRILYGTDMNRNPEMYRTTFRILESEDEHFYPDNLAKYHWPLHGFGLKDELLKKVYHDNAEAVMKRAQAGRKE